MRRVLSGSVMHKWEYSKLSEPTVPADFVRTRVHSATSLALRLSYLFAVWLLLILTWRVDCIKSLATTNITKYRELSHFTSLRLSTTSVVQFFVMHFNCRYNEKWAQTTKLCYFLPIFYMPYQYSTLHLIFTVITALVPNEWVFTSMQILTMYNGVWEITN